MKKILVFVIIFVLSLSFISCDWFSQTSSITDETASTTTNETTSTITQETTTTVEATIITILYPGVDTVEINSSWVDAGANLFVGDTEYNMTTTDTVDLTVVGLNMITYYYSYAGDEYTLIRYVMVVDSIAPEITLNAGIDTININDQWSDAGVSVEDNSLGDVSLSITGTVDTSIAGTYLITYEAVDESGNSSTITRYVTVID